MKRLAIVIAVVILSLPSFPSAQSTKTPLFSFHSNPWLNLHHFIRVVARGGSANADLSPAERMAWDAGVAFYKPYGQRDVLFDEGMVKIAAALHQAEGKTTLDGFELDADLRRTLQQVMPVYQKYWWPQHDRGNREWIAAVQPLVDRHGAAISQAIARAYNASWPATPIAVDVTPFAGPVGGFSTGNPPHVTVSSQDASYKGYAALEMVFHEASHAWDQLLIDGLDNAAKANNVTLPRQLWHFVLFYTAGELTTRELRARGVTDYVMYAVKGDVYSRGCAGCAEKITTAWGPYLDGKRSLNEALTQLVLAFK
jgi:hypothetical protein